MIGQKLRSIVCVFRGHRFGDRKRLLGESRPGKTINCKNAAAIVIEDRQLLSPFGPPLTDRQLLVFERVCERCSDD